MASTVLRELSLERLTFLNTTTLPPEWGARHSLTKLRLSRLSGVTSGIPPEWVSGMHGLRDIIFEAVTGMPTNVSDWVPFVASSARVNGTGTFWGLSSAALTSQNLTGQIPDSFFGSAKLGVLSLANNNLTGTLGAAWANAATAAVFNILDLGGNRIGGSLPDGWALFRLGSLNLKDNSLTGMREGQARQAVVTLGWRSGLPRG